jgi:hypothetical protein
VLAWAIAAFLCAAGNQGVQELIFLFCWKRKGYAGGFVCYKIAYRVFEFKCRQENIALGKER